MSHVILRRDTTPAAIAPEPGKWLKRLRDGEVVVLVTCPDCHTTADLGHHNITDLGFVSPSLRCPTDGCPWHVFVQLDGW